MLRPAEVEASHPDIAGWLKLGLTGRLHRQGAEPTLRILGHLGGLASGVHLKQPGWLLAPLRPLLFSVAGNQRVSSVLVALAMCNQLIDWAVFQKSCYKGNLACKSSTLVLQA